MLMNLVVLGRCASTMDEARALAAAGAADGTVVVADEQSRGRGTKGRLWHSPPGFGLYASIVVRPRPGESAAAMRLLPLAAGLAARDALREACGAEVRLKWPNDLVHGHRKVGGVLCESVSADGEFRYAVAGFGINLDHAETDFPPELRDSAASLRTIGAAPCGRDEVLRSLVGAFAARAGMLREGRARELLRDYETGLAFVPGDRIVVTTARGRTRGVFLGLDETGGLRLGPPPETAESGGGGPFIGGFGAAPRAVDESGVARPGAEREPTEGPAPAGPRAAADGARPAEPGEAVRFEDLRALDWE